GCLWTGDGRHCGGDWRRTAGSRKCRRRLQGVSMYLSMAVQAYAHQQGQVVGGGGEPARESGVAETKIAGGEDKSVAGDKESAGLDAGSTLRRGDRAGVCEMEEDFDVDGL
ncbi:unnamed protein product, partial [Pylaiella littoralis]